MALRTTDVIVKHPCGRDERGMVGTTPVLWVGDGREAVNIRGFMNGARRASLVAVEAARKTRSVRRVPGLTALPLAEVVLGACTVQSHERDGMEGTFRAP